MTNFYSYNITLYYNQAKFISLYLKCYLYSINLPIASRRYDIDGNHPN